ncbi:MAG: hypothetical protein M5R41_13570 [Bacteroidia bacterium]|nr:hypothetical protein [Bacteroidia bacterium]
MKYTSLLLLLFAVSFSAVRVHAQGSERYIINHFVSDPKVIESHLVITDVEGKGPIVTMKLYDNDGKLLGEGKELVQPFGKLNLNPGKYIDNRIANGTIHIESAGGNIVAEYWQFYKNAAESWKNTTTIGQEKKGYAQLVCPHFVSDPGVEVYIVLANADGKDAIVKLSFRDDSGKELASSRELVKANGKLVLQPSNIVKSKATGVVHITAEGGRVTADYWQAEAAKKYQIATPITGM